MKEIRGQIVIIVGLFTFTVFTGIFLFSNPTSAASASTATATVKIASSCTLTTTGGGNYSATVPNGTSAEIEGSTLTASCNDAGGFALYAVGYSNDTIGNNNMIGPNVNIATNTSGNDSYWAMKINPTTGNTPTIDNSFNDFHIVPNAHTKVASYSGSTGTGSLSVDATYKASISSTQLAGNYLGKVKYTLIHPSSGPAPAAPLAASDCPALSICYAPNADDIEGSMSGVGTTITGSILAGRQTQNEGGLGHLISVDDSEVRLGGYNYSRPGYGFAGWSPKYDGQVNTSDIIYGPQATVSTDSDNPEGADISTNGLILYPVWVASTGSMQTFSSSDCNAMSIGDVTARTDIRDNNVYTIAKLADGKCWMVENLRLSDDANITPSNTQSNNGAFGGVFTGLAKPESAHFGLQHEGFFANSLYSIDNSTINNIAVNDDSDPRYRIPRYNNRNTNRSDGQSSNRKWYAYGNYYTWSAAVADTTNHSEKNTIVSNTSLCPTGWRLPRGGANTNNDFGGLTNALGGFKSSGGIAQSMDSSTSPTGAEMSIRMTAYPNNYLYSGHYHDDSGGNINMTGYYWSSSVNDSSSSDTLFLSEGNVYPGTEVNVNWSLKSYGHAIRCLIDS